MLIVFVFAAVIAIMLYRAMPEYAFEARRQKEQLLIDRGNEYKHAVKLYYRKVGGYPASFEQLENTNRMRFLRHRFKDPFTDKDNWRLLHMGVGNRLLDSKVNPLQNNAKGGSSASAGASKIGSFTTGSSTFGSNTGGFTGLSSSASESEPAVVVPPVRHRGPAIPAAAGPAPENDLFGGPSPDETIPMPPAALPEPSAPVQTNADISQNGSQTSTTPPQTTNQQSNGGPNQIVQNLFNKQGPSRPGQNNSSTSGLGTLRGGGGLAGVASRASGQSIKTVDDQDDYSLWEFYYDPAKDVQPGLAGGGQSGAPSGSQKSSTPATNGAQSSGKGFHLGNGFGSGNSASNPPR